MVKCNSKNEYYGKLHVEGTHLCDRDNTPVQLKGLSSHGLGWYPQYINEQAFKEFRDDWNMNIIRLAMYTEEEEGYCSRDNNHKEFLKEVVSKGIEIARELKMYVIVDWHILFDNNPLIHIDEAIDFFEEISSKHKEDEHVLYEICNEPNGDTSWDDIKKYAEQVIPIIRKNAPESIIIVGTPTWSQDVDIASMNPISGYDNIMYALHFYADTHKDALRDKMMKALENQLPIFVSEYGICDASGNGAINPVEANKWISLLDELKISHIAWNLSNKDESSALLKKSCNKAMQFEEDDLNEGGIWLKDMLTRGVGL